jgi:hypothetical protein
MQFDIVTLYAVNMMIPFLVGGGFLLYRTSLKFWPGFNQWLYSYGLLSSTFLVLMLRGSFNISINIFLANFLPGLVVVLRLDGLYRFFEMPPLRRRFYYLILLISSISVISQVFNDSPMLRTFIINLLIIPCLIFSIHLLIQKIDENNRRINYLLIVTYLTYLFVFIVRIIFWFQNPTVGMLEPTFFHLLFYFAFIPFEICQGVGFLLLNTFRIDKERKESAEQLATTQQELKLLSGLLPICSHCKKIRDEEGKWTAVETYIAKRSDANFSHGICEDCHKEHYSEFLE